MDEEPGKLTAILEDLSQGDREAASRLLPLVYEELRRLAHQRMGVEGPGHTLQPTALVHEAYLRLIGDDADALKWDSRGHFFAAAAEAMRRILIERARKYAADKHGGGRQRVSLADEEPGGDGGGDDEGDTDILALDAALQRLEQTDPVRSQVVKLRFFAGLTIDQAADALGVSAATANRHWTYARAWLTHEIVQGR